MGFPNNRYITERMPDADYVAALQNFYTVANANKVVLGLAPADLTEIQKASSEAANLFNAWVAAQAAANNARAGKDTQFGTSRTVINKWAKTFRANQAISDAILEQLLVAKHRPNQTFSAPATPANFNIQGNGTGLVSLTWSRNGNTAATTFVIQYRESPTAPWTIVGTSTSSKFSWQGTAGVYASFRVYATKKSRNSEATAPLAVWDNGNFLTLSKAA